MPALAFSYSPFDYQRAFHEAGQRWRVALGGRRSGKSLAALHELLRHALTTPDANAWWVSPTLSDARDVGWEMAMEALEPMRPLVASINQVRMQVRFKRQRGAKGESVVTFKGAESERSLRGRSISFVVIDEAAFVAEAMWRRCIRPALSDRGGRAVLCSTPNGLNWLSRQWEFARAHPESWATFHWPSRVNPMLAPADLADAKASLSPQEWAQEYEAQFVTRAGQVYPDFSEANIVESFSPAAADFNFYLGIDPGYASHAAVVFLAVPKAEDHRLDGKATVTQFDEIYATRRDVHALLSDIHRTLAKHKLKPADVRKVYTDPAGNAAESTSGISPANIIRSAGYQVENQKSEVAPGLALVRSLVLNAAGERRYTVARNCTETIRSLRGYSYQLGRNETAREEPHKDGVHDHLADALRYALINKFGGGAAVVRFARLAQM